MTGFNFKKLFPSENDIMGVYYMGLLKIINSFFGKRTMNMVINLQESK